MSTREAAQKAMRHRVLIVDDEESMRLVLARILVTALRAEVTLAGTCEQALHLAGSYAYDAILLDLLMPGIGGYEVLRRLRRASPNVATPVIIVSVLADAATQNRHRLSGKTGGTQFAGGHGQGADGRPRQAEVQREGRTCLKASRNRILPPAPPRAARC